ncbi:hypothetical protein PVAP13_1KG521835 [Panicum virgatum]|uniref:Uncharacterized protein n=1 Tax=Panicum virgatum TaxID=38727 RepID=A0A8T0XKU8_PANVG|nr:hypothetical protein PVAP13_1KG521835 [Panicum virgatum]
MCMDSLIWLLDPRHMPTQASFSNTLGLSPFTKPVQLLHDASQQRLVYFYHKNTAMMHCHNCYKDFKKLSNTTPYISVAIYGLSLSDVSGYCNFCSFLRFFCLD